MVHDRVSQANVVVFLTGATLKELILQHFVFDFGVCMFCVKL